jgi:hypothetical protein
LLVIFKDVPLFFLAISKTVQTRFWVLVKNIQGKSTIKIPTGMDCCGNGNGSVKPINKKYTLPSIM